MQFKNIPIYWAEKEIPQGIYCYSHAGNKQKTCPFWHIRKDQPEQDNGFCALLNQGDWQDQGISLLWDQVKECGINTQEPDFEDMSSFTDGSNEIIALPVKIKGD